MPKYFIRYPESEMRESLAHEITGKTGLPVVDSRTNPNISIAELDEQSRSSLERRGAKIYENLEFEKFGEEPNDEFADLAAMLASVPEVKTVNDVLDEIAAVRAWTLSTGAGVMIAVVDSGVDGSRPEFTGKRFKWDVPSEFAGEHWVDPAGHGTMCAAIACARKENGARYSGVAPDAQLISARTTLKSDDIYDIFEQLIIWKSSGQITAPLVVNNSYGLKTCVALHQAPEDHPYVDIIRQAVATGIVVVFAAGNNHLICKHDTQSHEPNTIWAANSVDEVLCVGAVDSSYCNTNKASPHCASSRGPGQWAHKHTKPDCVAPCYGEVLWGGSYLFLPWWGTSGSAPQVAGLAALLLAKNPLLTPAEVATVIRGSCKTLKGHEYCVGKGSIDCYKALSSI